MMNFEMDVETFNDLEIFTQGEGSKSIFSIFNRTRTAGGKAGLREMMLNPTFDVDLLITRRDTIRYFQERELELDFNFNQLDMIEHYLNFNKKVLRNNILDATFNHLYNKVSSTSDYYIIEAGVSALIKLLQFIAQLVEKITADPGCTPLTAKIEPILILLEHKKISKAIRSNQKTTNFLLLHQLDNIFRKKEVGSIKLLLQFVYEIDVYESAAEILKREGWSMPEYLPPATENFSILGLYHPAIGQARPNDINLSSDKSLVFLTGPNMAGKSSFLKSVGIAVFLAHIGFPVPARQMTTPVYKGLLTTINLPDDIYNGASHYYSEVKRLKKAAIKLLERDSMFVIFDELFRGTNVKDAFEASLVVINNLCRIRNCKFLISTHIIELAGELKSQTNISFKYFESSFVDGKPLFTYTMRDGVSNERLGMYIMENEGVISIFQQVIERKATK